MNKYKTLALNTAIFAIGNFGAKILSFFLTRLYTANLESADFNTKEVLEMCANFLIPVVSFSITEAVVRFGLDRNYEKEEVFSNAVMIELFGVICFLLLSPLLLLYPDVRGFVPLLVGYTIISCFRQLSTTFARAREKVTLFAVDGILCTLSLFVFNVIFVGWLQLGITGFMFSVMLSDLLSGITVWLVAGHGKYFSPKYMDKELLEVMLRHSVPLIPTAILWIITGFSDRLFIKHIVSAEDAGVYGAATKIPNLLSMVSTIFYQAWNMSAIAENDSKGRGEFYTRIYDAYQAVLALAGGFIIALDVPLTKLLVSTGKDAAYADAYLYTPVLVIASVMMCFNQFLSSIYMVSRRTQNSFWTSLVAAVLNLVLNAVLITKFGVHGAIAATFASYFVCYAIRIVDARRYIPFTVSHWRFVANVLLLFFLSRLIHHPPAYCILWQIAGLLAIAMLNIKPLLQTAEKLLPKRFLPKKRS